jgi:hypothetical protein
MSWKVANRNVVFIMGDYIGWMQPSVYHQGLMVGEECRQLVGD